MAPKKNLAGKAVEKKIAAPKKTIQKRVAGKTKSSAQPKSEPQAAVVRQEPMSSQEMPPSAESAGIGMQRGRVSALLTSLKYQMNAKKILRNRRRTQKENAAQLLERYHQGTLEDKKEILAKLDSAGVHSLGWINTMQKSTHSVEKESEKIMSNMLTRILHFICLML